MSRAVARRYARALFAHCEDESADLEAISTELDGLAEIFANREVIDLASTPTLGEQARASIAEKVAEALGLSKIVGSLLSLMARNDRLESVGDASIEMRELVDAKLGRVRGHVSSAKALDDEDLDRIRSAFAKRTGKEVLVTTEVDEALLGGVVVEVEGRVYDGSVHAQLEGLRSRLAG